MRILFLSKRRYMGKDVIVDRYARMYEFPFQLAKRGHEVLACCLSYRAADEGRWTHQANPGMLEWRSWNLGRTMLPGLVRFRREALAAAKDFGADIVLGSSDIPHCALARHFAGYLGVPHAIDLYDNFESYGQARLPGAVKALRWAARGAGHISCVSAPLSHHVRSSYGVTCPVVTLESTVDRDLFRPADRVACRKQLGLPPDAQLIGTAGALSADKGISALYDAFNLLVQDHPDLHLIVAGPSDPTTPPPSGSRVHVLGALPHTQVPTLFNALDVAVICIRDTLFGRYSFPQKAYEMIACGVPVVAADIGAMSTLLQAFPESLYRADDASDLAQKLAGQLRHPAPVTVPIKGWDELAGELEQGLQQALSN